MDSPKISVCIPVRNGGGFLPLALDSVLSQSFSEFELVVIDNFSSDGTAEWLERWVQSVPNARLYRNSSDLGLVANFNACLARATGSYIKFLCADDLLLPDCLCRMSGALDADPSATLVIGGRRLIDEKGRTITTERFTRHNATMPGTDVINRCFFGKNYIGEPSAVMFRKNLSQRGFSTSLSHLLDLEMWFHLLERGRMISLADEVCAVRRHTGQMSRHSLKSGALIEDNIFLFKEYGDKSYIRGNWYSGLNRRVRMAYRVWMCKDALSIDKRNKVLAEHSSRLFYYTLMPILAKLLSAWRQFGSLLKRQGNGGTR